MNLGVGVFGILGVFIELSLKLLASFGAYAGRGTQISCWSCGCSSGEVLWIDSSGVY